MTHAILFDLFETLVTESATRPPGVSSLAPLLGCDRQAFRARWVARRPSVMAGRLSFREALREIAQDLGRWIDDETLDDLSAQRRRTRAKAFERIDPDVLGMLGQLRARAVRLAVISNCVAEDVAAWPGCAVAPLIDCTLFSFEAGRAKPDPVIYLDAVQRLGVEASRTLFIGDGGDDELAGAGQAGLRAFRALWFLRRWPHWREDSPLNAGLATCDEVLGLL